MFLRTGSLSHPRHAAAPLLTVAAFVIGIAAATAVGPLLAETPRAQARLGAAGRAPAPAAARSRPVPGGYPAEVLRVIDGDTFVARVRVWPGLAITTRVRLRGIDAPELHARCREEWVKAQAARDALARLLAEGRVGIAAVGQDKYGGRVDATASTRRTADVSQAMLAGGFARPYAGGRRRGWCRHS